MTLGEFLDNPVGKGDASINMKLLRSALDDKYRVYEDVKKKKIEMKVFHQPIKDIYWIWLVIPTETDRDNSYDIIYTFTNPKSTDRVTQAIGKFDIQIFANTPSFAFTHAYVYNKNGLLIPSLSNKLGRTFLTDSPSVRNRNENLLYDKYVYYGARYIQDSKILNRMIADMKAMKYDPQYMAKYIRSLDTIMDEYKIAEEKLRGKKRKAKDKVLARNEQEAKNNTLNRVSGTKKVGTITPVTKTKGTISKKGGTIKKR